MSPLTTEKSSAQSDTVSLPKQTIYQNCSLLKLQSPELTKPLSNLMLRPTNPQTNWLDRSTLSVERAHQVWCKFKNAWASNHWLEADRFRGTKSGQISSFLSSPKLCCVCSAPPLTSDVQNWDAEELGFFLCFILPFEVTSTVGSSTKSMVTSIGLVGYFDDYYAGLQIISMWRDSPTLNGHIGKGSLWIWMIDIHKQSIISLWHKPDDGAVDKWTCSRM